MPTPIRRFLVNSCSRAIAALFNSCARRRSSGAGLGCPELVKDYTSPGDIVIGPFHGDWYDAARLYRKWAVTAPWCAKGPIYKRKDYPQWFADVPYWTTSYFDSGEYYIEEQINTCKAFDLPLSVTQVYCWSYTGTNNDRAPEVFPPKLGSEGMKQTVE